MRTFSVEKILNIYEFKLKKDCMNLQEITQAYDFTGKTAAITGGGGVLCSEMARCLAGCNANIVILDRDMLLGEKVVAEPCRHKRKT